MNRRDFLAGAATGVVAGTASAYAVTQHRRDPAMPPQETAAPKPASAAKPAAPAIAKGIRELKMVTTWSKNFPGLGTGAQRVADRVGALTGGKLIVQLFAGGELVPHFESFDAVSSGAADMYHGADYYWRDKSQAFNFFATVPGGFTASELNAWIHHGGGQKLWDELAAGFNIKPMLCGNTGMQMGGWFNKEIKSLDDLNGLKMRVPGLGGEVMRRLGASIIPLASKDVFPALQNRAIDAAEWFGPWNDLAFGFHKVTKNYYGPGFHEPGLALTLGINKEVWDSLSQDQQYVLLHASSAENDYMRAEFDARNGEALSTLANQHGVQLRSFPDDVLKAAGAASAEVVAEIGNSDGMTKRVYDSYIAFRASITRWTTLSEKAYMTARGAFFPA
ncbi:TRAP transporter substrate-binding protein [Rhodospirillaceae bacterium SYSU D60014]|uniref:TRAP transporter substrate-binding protein n=1 Tax=Virgifigura deserti TaxID=2268457 RepID=UPI000E67084C